MAIVKTGNALTSPLLQPGAKFLQDGYGLTVGTLSFKVDKAGSSASFFRGASCPIAAFSYCKMHKASVDIGALDLDTWTAEYVGIAGGSATTEPQITGSQGLTSEAITTHPNFFELATGFSGSPIAGVGASPGTKTTPNYAAVTGTGTEQEFEGNNGATFQYKIGRKFLGFKKAQFSDFYGKTNYLAPQCSISGIFYTTTASIVNDHRNAVGKTSGNGTFAGKKLVPDYMGTSFTISGKNQLLLAQVSFEDFGLLYKVQYELRFNREGYVASVYAPA
jgi:hypothetical protein